MTNPQSLLRDIGSLWFASVLLVILLVAMASATAYESARGTDQALAVFYHSWWFRGFLGLLALNAGISIAIRLPPTRRDVGFLCTHGGVLVILAGSVLTQFSVESGSVALEEGEVATSFELDGTKVLTVTRRSDGTRAEVDLSDHARVGFEIRSLTQLAPLRVGGISVQPLRYLADADWRSELRDDLPFPQPALEVLLSTDGTDHPEVVFADEPVDVDGLVIRYRVARSAEELEQLLARIEPALGFQGQIHVELSGQHYEFNLEEGLAGSVPLGDSGLSAKVLRYLPHASVGAGGQVVNVSDQPQNPFVEVEFTGADVQELRQAFARFPDFHSMHDTPAIEDLKVTLAASAAPPPTPPVDIVGIAGGGLSVRFTVDGGPGEVRPIEPGEVLETPWSGRSLTVRRRLEHAWTAWTPDPVEPPRSSRQAGIVVRVDTATEPIELPMRLFSSVTWVVDGESYDIGYGSKEVPLGFSIRLDQFQIRTYPGSGQPRSFESSVTVIEPATLREQTRVIRINHPAEFGRFTLYQSSYDVDGPKPVSILSVSRDPGQIVVFAGFFILMGGLWIGLGLRMSDRRHRAQPHAVNS